MEITHVTTGVKVPIRIELLLAKDYKLITKRRYWFDWNTERRNLVYKLRLTTTDDILGLISLIRIDEEKRLEINLLAVSIDNRGKNKIYEDIAGSLVAYACREALKLYADEACVSMIPKTKLREHYIKKYGMLDAGWQLFLEGRALFKLIKKYRV